MKRLCARSFVPEERWLDEDAEKNEVVMEQVGLGSMPELVFHQLVARVNRTVHPISMFPEHVYSSGPSVGFLIDPGSARHPWMAGGPLYRV